MPSYAKVAVVVGGMPPDSSDELWLEAIVPELIDIWINDYGSRASIGDVIETSAGGFSYLFDTAHGRLIAAWGLSRGRHDGKRDAARMAGHPLGAGSAYHRGHAIPHTLGGPTDINLVAQLGAVNIGPFRPLERQAVATPGSLYFTYWIYGPGDSQKPVAVEQGLLSPGALPDIRVHGN